MEDAPLDIDAGALVHQGFQRRPASALVAPYVAEIDRMGAELMDRDTPLLRWNINWTFHAQFPDRRRSLLTCLTEYSPLVPGRDWQQDDLVHKNNGLPSWAPLDYDNEKQLNLNYIKFDDRLRNAGLGRHVINTLQQALTTSLNPEIPIHLKIDECHFPIFYTIDSHFHWWRYRGSDDGKTINIPARTPARKIYPRYLISDDIYSDDGESADDELGQQEAENAKAIYAPRGTPLVTAYALGPRSGAVSFERRE